MMYNAFRYQTRRTLRTLSLLPVSPAVPEARITGPFSVKSLPGKTRLTIRTSKARSRRLPQSALLLAHDAVHFAIVEQELLHLGLRTEHVEESCCDVACPRALKLQPIVMRTSLRSEIFFTIWIKALVIVMPDERGVSECPPRRASRDLSERMPGQSSANEAS